MLMSDVVVPQKFHGYIQQDMIVVFDEGIWPIISEPSRILWRFYRK